MAQRGESERQARAHGLHPQRPCCPSRPPGAFRAFDPALVLSLLDPKLTWTEAESGAAVAAGVVVRRADGAPLSPYDLKRLQVGRRLPARACLLERAAALPAPALGRGRLRCVVTRRTTRLHPPRTLAPTAGLQAPTPWRTTAH